MRFKSLHLLRFGSFTDYSLDLNDSPGRLQIIYGANESGKSTMLRAIGDLLYGFGQLTSDAYLHDMTALRVGARFVTDGGDAFDAYRRKGKNKTLLDVNEKPLESDPIAPLLSAADRQNFERLLGLDHNRLRRGGEELLKGGGNVAFGLFQAGAGVASVRQVLERLDEEADSLFRPKGSIQRINQELKQLSDERAKTRQASLSAEQYHRLSRELAGVDKELSTLIGQIGELETQRQQRERVRANLGPIALRTKLRGEYSSLADIPSLAPECTRSRQEAEERLHKASAKSDQATSRIQDLERRRGEQPVEEGILAAAAKIKLIENLLTKVAGAVEDLPRRESAADTSRSNVEALLRDARLDVAADVAEQRLPATPQIQLIRRLAEERESIVARHDELIGQIQELESEIEAKTKKLEAIPECTDPELLERSIQIVMKLGPVEKRLAQLRREVEQRGNQLNQAMEALPLWTGTPEELGALQVPLDATVVRCAKELQTLHASVETSQQRLAEAEAAKNSAEQELELIKQAGDVPTSAVVADAREHRDVGWKLVRRSYIDQLDDVAAEAAAFDQGRTLPDAYEVAVINADELTDRRQAETARVARFEHAVQKLEECRTNEISWSERTAEAARELAEHQRNWRSHWLSAKIDPLPPEEMRDWLQDRSKLLEQAVRNGELWNELEGEKSKLIDAQQVLANAIGQVGTPPPVDTSLQQLLATTESKARALRMSLERRNALSDTLLQLDSKLRTLGIRLSKSDLALAEWATRWSNALVEIHRESDSHPAEIRALLDVYDALRVELTKWKDMNSRVLSMRLDRDNLKNALNDVTSALAPEFSTLPMLDAAAKLVTRLEDAKKSKNDHDHIERELERAHREIEDANREQDEATAILTRLCELAGCGSPGELEEIEAKASRRRRVEEELREVEKQLLQSGFGFTVEELVREAEGVSADKLTEEILTITNAQNTRREAEKTLIDRRAVLRRELAEMTGADDAANGAQRSENLISEMCESADRWQVLKVASELLRRGIERYRQQNQGPVIGRASEQFRALTLGRYVRLSVDYGAKDEPVLMGVRPEGREVGVEAMSDGTRDQLFLALRIAVLEQFLSKSETLPVIADDLLINFDDERSSAALQALCALAQRTQVLYFTHHQTIVELARKNLEQDTFVVQELPG